MSKKVSKKMDVLLIVPVIAVLVALTALIIIVYKMGGLGQLTGHASQNVTGSANLTVTSQAQLSFTTSIINWGSGAVNSASPNSTLDSEGGSYWGNWTAVSQGLTLVNGGNSNLTVNLTTSNVASAFIGGTLPYYKLKVTENESGSCETGTNITVYTDATGAQQWACIAMDYVDTRDALDIDVQLVIPKDALPGAKGSIITATGTPV